MDPLLPNRELRFANRGSRFGICSYCQVGGTDPQVAHPQSSHYLNSMLERLWKFFLKGFLLEFFNVFGVQFQLLLWICPTDATMLHIQSLLGLDFPRFQQVGHHSHNRELWVVYIWGPFCLHKCAYHSRSLECNHLRTYRIRIWTTKCFYLL
jgi:hypothetical protein